MARQPRFFVAGQPLHVVQRGNNHTTIFSRPSDFRLFLDYLLEAVQRHDVLIHAYVLMTNHWHLLGTPLEANSLPKALQSVGRRYVQRFNWTYGRSGTLWEGRYRASLIHNEHYLFTCMRYIELNPVRAGMAAEPGKYAWSSYRANAEGVADALITPHELYDGLAATSPQRQNVYRALFGSPLGNEDIDAIRSATNRNWALGDDSFKQNTEALSGRRAAPVPKGRPKSKDSENRV